MSPKFRNRPRDPRLKFSTVYPCPYNPDPRCRWGVQAQNIITFSQLKTDSVLVKVHPECQECTYGPKEIQI